MEEPEKLLVLNPIVNSDLKKYIWFNSVLEKKQQALSLFFRFLVMEVYIDGFATDEEEYIGAKAFNKPIVDIGLLKAKEAVVFVEEVCNLKAEDICQPLEIINPALQSEHILIFGAGKYGVEIFKRLSKQNRKIECFIDSDKSKCYQKNMQSEIPIKYIDALDMYTEKNVSIVEAAEKYKEMDQLLQKRQFKGKRFYYINENQIYLKYIFGISGDDLLFSINAITNMCILFKNMKLFFYGEQTTETKRIAHQIRLLDFDFRGFLCDERFDEIEEKEYPYIFTEEILYEENFYIIMQNDQKKIKKLYDLGLNKGSDFNILPELGFDTHVMQSMLDLNLGYTYRENSQYPGIAIYGNDIESDFKIAVLGGSTTDDLYDKRTWVRILYEMLCERGFEDRLTVYNGGVSGYASTQELLKLIRDILPLKPDLILVYDVYNDLCENPERPFAFPYLQTIFNYAQRNENVEKLGSDGFGGDVSEISMGIKTNESYFENWISKIELMHAVAKVKNIPFLSFAQPTRYSMHNSAIKDEWFLSSFVFWIMDHHPAMDFRDSLAKEKVEERYDYIIDLSGIFDDHPEVYKDSCHLWESGNKIIAEKILNVIETKGFWKGEKNDR